MEVTSIKIYHTRSSSTVLYSTACRLPLLGLTMGMPPKIYTVLIIIPIFSLYIMGFISWKSVTRAEGVD